MTMRDTRRQVDQLIDPLRRRILLIMVMFSCWRPAGSSENEGLLHWDYVWISSDPLATGHRRKGCGSDLLHVQSHVEYHVTRQKVHALMSRGFFWPEFDDAIVCYMLYPPVSIEKWLECTKRVVAHTSFAPHSLQQIHLALVPALQALF